MSYCYLNTFTISIKINTHSMDSIPNLEDSLQYTTIKAAKQAIQLHGRQNGYVIVTY